MMQCTKAKPAPIADVLSKNKAGQFLIAPVRYSLDIENARIEIQSHCLWSNGWLGVLLVKILGRTIMH